MNYSIIRKMVSKIAIIFGILMAFPLIFCIAYHEPLRNYLSFIIPIVGLLALGITGTLLPVANSKMHVKESLIIVSLSWIVLTLVGAVPFVISGAIPNYIDAVFEAASGFSTTGSSIIDDVEALTENFHSVMMWRSFTHWIGGMGILVFVLALIPESSDGSAMNLLKAESPGPQVGKLVSKLKNSSQILYLIYIVLTIIEVVFLVLGPDMNLYESLVHAFGTAGTGGFGIFNDSIAGMSNYTQIVITVFMFIFGINFSLYYFLLIGNFKNVLKSEELHAFLGIAIVSVLIITFNIFSTASYNGNFGLALKDAFFQVGSIMSTTGFSTADYTLWPALSKIIIVILMVFGAMAGSTAGGIKTSRVIILFKHFIKKIKNATSPHKVEHIRLEGKPLSNELVANTTSYMVVYVIVFFVCALLISITDGGNSSSLVTNLSASLTCISNVGPGFGLIAPFKSFSFYSSFSKIILSLEMIIGRLEFIPVLILFNPANWRRT